MDLMNLPNELLIKVLGYAGVDLISFLLLNKEWYSFICQQAELWANLHIESRRPVVASQIIGHLSKCKRRKISVRVAAPIYDAVRLLNYLAYQEYLQMIDLGPDHTLEAFMNASTQFNYLRSVSMGSELLDHDLAWCMEHLPALSDLCLVQTSCNISGVTFCTPVVSKMSLLKLVGNVRSPNIDSSFLDKILEFTNPEEVFLVDVIDYVEDVKGVLDKETTRKFRFSSRHDATMLEPQTFIAPLKSPLTSLWLSGMCFDIHGVKQTPLSLKDLKISHSRLAGDYCLGTLLQHFGCTETLETLELTATDVGRILPFELEPCPRLWFLKLCDMPKDSLVEGHLLDWINHFLPNLRVLDVGGCKLSMFEYINLVRHGIKVLYHENLVVEKRILEWSNTRGVVLEKSNSTWWEKS